jgi:hypothetical protein
MIKRIGDRPTREQYKNAVIGDYPGWIIVAAAVMLIAVFIASASISTFRLYAAGKSHFLESLPIMWQAQVTGYATALMAEFLVVTAAASMTVFFKGWWRALMIAPVLIGLAVAFTGNWQITQPDTLWGWLDTFAPPLAVLSVAIIGERIILLSIRQRWQNEQAYQHALAAWEQSTADPESNPQWRAVYMGALKNKLQEVNAKGRGQQERREVMQTMTGADWRAVVLQELHADDWTEGGESAPVHVGALLPAFSVIDVASQERENAPLATSPNGRNHNGTGAH